MSVELIKTEELPALPGFSWATAADGIVAVAGQVAFDAQGQVVGDGDPEAQAEQIFHNIDAVLRAAGSSLDRIMHLRCFVTNTDAYPAYAAARGRWLGDHAPAGTTVVVSALLDPRLQIEVEVLAQRAEAA